MEKIEEFKARTQRWSMISDYAREATAREIAVSMEANHRRKLERCMTLFQQELAKLPEIERLRMSTVLSKTLINALCDIHITSVHLNGLHQIQRAGTPGSRLVADQQAKRALDDAIELYGL